MTPGLLKRAGVTRTHIPSLRDVLEHPDEVWLTPFGDTRASVVLRRRYLRAYDIGGERLVLVATVQKGALVGYEAVTEAEAAPFRSGQRLFNARS